MAKPKDLRDIVIGHFLNGATVVRIVDMLLKKVSERTVRRWIRDYVLKNKTDRVKPPGRPASATSSSKILKAKTLFSKKYSARKIAKLIKVSPRSVRRIKKNLALKPYVPQYVPLLSEIQKKKRVVFTRWWRKDKALLNGVKLREKRWMWSDEKEFCLNGGLNKQNNRIYAKTRAEANLNGALIGRKKYPLSVMVWVGLTVFGPILYFWEKGVKINGQNYSRRVLELAKREGDRFFGNDDWVFQQDGAPAHSSNFAQRWCANNFKYFLPKDRWPPNSPDLNPLDYYFWNAVQTRMKEFDPFNTTEEEFKDEIKRAVFSVPIDEIRNGLKSIDRRTRLVEDSGGSTYNK